MRKASVVQRDAAKVTLAASCVFDVIQISQVLVGGHLRRVEPQHQDAACRLGVHFLQRIFRNSLSESQSFVG
jgi:hypothetical protein